MSQKRQGPPPSPKSSLTKLLKPKRRRLESESQAPEENPEETPGTSQEQVAQGSQEVAPLLPAEVPPLELEAHGLIEPAVPRAQVVPHATGDKPGPSRPRRRESRRQKAKKISPRAGPSSAPDDGTGEQVRSQGDNPMFRPRVPDSDDSSQSSSAAPPRDPTKTDSVESMDIDDPDNLMKVDSSSSIERDSTYRLDYTGSRM